MKDIGGIASPNVIHSIPTCAWFRRIEFGSNHDQTSYSLGNAEMQTHLAVAHRRLDEIAAGFVRLAAYHKPRDVVTRPLGLFS